MFKFILFPMMFSLLTLQAVAGPLKLYMSADGNDERDGLSPVNSVRTLARANSLLYQYLKNNHQDAIVYIKSGVYKGQYVNWTFTMPENKIRIIGDSRGRPIFDGNPNTGPQAGVQTFFSIKKNEGQYTNVWIENLKIKNYMRGFLFGSVRTQRGLDQRRMYNGKNRIVDCEFYRIGNKWVNSDKFAVAAISLMNSDYNLIKGNLFHYVENVGSADYKRALHAVYAAHGSDRNTIQNNMVRYVSGHPFKFRDRSNYNVMVDNVVDQSGYYVGSTPEPRMVQIWHHGQDGKHFGIDGEKEHYSYKTEVYDNLIGKYYGSSLQANYNPPVCFQPPRARYCHDNQEDRYFFANGNKKLSLAPHDIPGPISDQKTPDEWVSKLKALEAIRGRVMKSRVQHKP